MSANRAIGEADVTRFAELIEQRLGLQYGGSSLTELEAVLARRMHALQCASFHEYRRRLEAAVTMQAEMRELAAKLTIGETYFFRSPEQLNVFSEIALPRLTRTDPARRIRILSAGCSTGEEPYTLAMTLRELGPSAPAGVSILGLDINPAALAKARRGRYSAWAMRATRQDHLEKYFRREHGEFVLDEDLRAMVEFEERGLAAEDHRFWQPDSFDIIFCRNVTMYLSARALGEVIARFARVLAADGFLFLSHAEPLRGISQAFHVEHAQGSFYYVLRNASGSSAHDRLTAASCVVAKSGLAEPAPTPPEMETLAEQRPSLSLGAVFMKGQQYDEALATLEALAPADRLDPDVLLLTAIIQVERGKLEEAAQLCASLLALDDLNAAAHYLTALCHEHGGRRAAAIDSYRVGVYMDSAFAMPHLRLGLMFRHDGDLAGARRELQNASILLAQEDPDRVLRFGGGFSRKTLIDLCASELRLCEGSN
jgi:chemotaxis protein methyltransferase CheR